MSESSLSDTLFAVRGNLDGEVEAEYVDKEQFIGLKIGEEEFLLPIAIVNEINMLQPITFVPQVNESIEGVINLRGTILPAINIRKMMGLERCSVSPSVRIIIVRHLGMQFGLIVDGITYVVSLLPSEIEVQVLPGNSVGADFISRISKNAEKVKGILDISKVIAQVAGNKLSEIEEKMNDAE